jgi:hypothetical protein
MVGTDWQYNTGNGRHRGVPVEEWNDAGFNRGVELSNVLVSSKWLPVCRFQKRTLHELLLRVLRILDACFAMKYAIMDGRAMLGVRLA